METLAVLLIGTCQYMGETCAVWCCLASCLDCHVFLFFVSFLHHLVERGRAVLLTVLTRCVANVTMTGELAVMATFSLLPFLRSFLFFR